MNYTELNQTIVEYTENNELSFVTDIPKFVRLAEQRIYHEVKLPQFRTSLLFYLTAGSSLQPLPADFLAAFALMIDDGTSIFSYLDLKEPEYATVAFGSKFGLPRVYALRQDKELIVAPTPDMPYQATLSYFYYPESITVAPTGRTWLGDNFSDVLLYGSLIEAYVFMKGEADIMQAYQAQYTASLKLFKTYALGPLHNDSYKAVAV
jgi:hypothetical protein